MHLKGSTHDVSEFLRKWHRKKIIEGIKGKDNKKKIVYIEILTSTDNLSVRVREYREKKR